MGRIQDAVTSNPTSIAQYAALAACLRPRPRRSGEPGSQIFIPGDTLGYHQSTHEEPIDPVLGYQPRVARAVLRP